MTQDPDPCPTPPEKPLPTDCCGSGCPVCVLDAYDEAWHRYRSELAAWQRRNPDRSGDVEGDGG